MRFVELALLGHLGEQFRNVTLKVGLDIADSLRLAVERIGGVQQRVVIELDERFERDAQPLAIIEYGAVMIGNPPRPRLEIEAVLEAAGLRLGAELRKSVAAAQRPVASSGTAVELQDLDLVAGRAQFERRRHAGETRAKNQYRCPLGMARHL